MAIRVAMPVVSACLTAAIFCSARCGGADEKDTAQKDREQIIASLRALGEAMHAYHEAHGWLPPHAVCTTGGKPLLSWRVALLPYLKEKELYEQFRLHEEWNSEHNKKVLKEMPGVYAPVGVKPKERHATF